MRKFFNKVWRFINHPITDLVLSVALILFVGYFFENFIQDGMIDAISVVFGFCLFLCSECFGIALARVLKMIKFPKFK